MTKLVDYSWIAYQFLRCFFAFAVWFQNQDNFGFLIRIYTKHGFKLFYETTKRASLASFHVLDILFLFFVTVSAVELKSDILLR